MTKPIRIYFSIFFSLFLYSFIGFHQQENHPPIVKIITPQNNSSFDKDASITYKISVSDKEDGDSKFDEINSKEVLLEVRYLKSGKVLSSDRQSNPGLNTIMTSNCVTCHNFNTKAMGPSFYDINKRYPATKANTDSLIKRIKEGSTGIWGKEKMPAHPELSATDIKNIAQWIMKNATDPNVNYYVGTDGYFRFKPDAQKSTCQLTASYTDHGLKDAPGKRLRGQDAVTIHIK
ncbi:MAG TPA: c-type cytochrome [Mucilaginibacter sp.]|jgi:cytochrome c|nr:c-type cytochrome [Mucilaginibacter sp.]